MQISRKLRSASQALVAGPNKRRTFQAEREHAGPVRDHGGPGASKSLDRLLRHFSAIHREIYGERYEPTDRDRAAAIEFLARCGGEIDVALDLMECGFHRARKASRDVHVDACMAMAAEVAWQFRKRVARRGVA